MDMRIYQDALENIQADALILPIATDSLLGDILSALDKTLGGWLSETVQESELATKLGEVTVLMTHDKIKAKRLIIVGLGAQEAVSSDTWRRVAAWGVQKARQLKLKSSGCYAEDTNQLRWMAEGAELANYQYLGQKTQDAQTNTLDQWFFVIDGHEDEALANAAIATGKAFAEGTIIARDLSNLPPNICTPDYLAQRAEQIGEGSGFRVTVLGRQQMQTLKMGALLAVAQGSAAEPRFIIMEHGQASANTPTLVLIGKGVTFDTGGYSLKTVDGMVGMKGDMGGGAAVIGAMYTIS